jgi:hypothetical protein
VSWDLYDAQSIGQLPWPQTPDAEYARRLLPPLMADGVTSYIANLQTELYALRIDDLVLPVTVNDGEYGNAYPCSPFTHYGHAAWDEARRLKPWVLRPALGALIAPVAGILRAGQINRVVHVNNWLLSTNLYPVLSVEQLRCITGLTERFPSHSLILRSLNDQMHGDLLTGLQALGYRLIPSRQVWLHDVCRWETFSLKARWQLRRDIRRVAESGYAVVDHEALTPADLPRIRQLYRLLYLEKHSLYNPDFTERFFALALETGSFHLVALRKAGRIDAVLGYFWRNGAMTAPIFGYDTSLPQETGLYRMISGLLAQEARRRGLLLHASSGAAEFKRMRGAVPAIEYSAVYDKHLPWHRRLPWAVLEGVLNRVAVPLIQRLRL